MTPRHWLLSCEELPSKNQGCGGQASSDSGATSPRSKPSESGIAWPTRRHDLRSPSRCKQPTQGKHKTGKVCVYIRRLANVDLKVLETLVARSVAEMKSRYPQPNENDP
jgi:hypothetical protein